MQNKLLHLQKNNIWQGNLGGAQAGEFDGFTTLAAADGDVIDVAAVGGGVNSGNVIAELGKIVDAIPSTLYGKDDLTHLRFTKHC